LFLTACSVPRGTSEVSTTVDKRIGHPIATEHGARERDAVQALLARPLDAERAVAIAMLQNPRLQASLAELGVARAAVVSASRIENPEASGALRFLANGGKPDIELMATESLTSLIALPIARGAADKEFEAAKLDAARAALDLAFEVRRAFYAYQASVRLQELAELASRAAEGSAALAGRLREAGNITQLDADSQTVLSEELRAELTQLTARAAAEREHLAALIGVRAAFEVVRELSDPTGAERDAVALERTALAQNLDLRALALRAQAASRAHDVAVVRGVVPDLRAGVAAERRELEGWSVGPAVALRLPLFDQNQGASARAEAMQQSAQARGAAVELDVRAASRAVAKQLAAAREATLRYRDVVLPLWTSIVDQAQRQYNAMQISVFQLVSAKRGQLAAQQKYVLALRDYWLQRSAADQLVAGSLPLDVAAGMSSAPPHAGDAGGAGAIGGE
jgi:cobalt-zinc-cadmium efflux system outer membrane protein